MLKWPLLISTHSFVLYNLGWIIYVEVQYVTVNLSARFYFACLKICVGVIVKRLCLYLTLSAIVRYIYIFTVHLSYFKVMFTLNPAQNHRVVDISCDWIFIINFLTIKCCHVCHHDESLLYASFISTIYVFGCNRNDWIWNFIWNKISFAHRKASAFLETKKNPKLIKISQKLTESFLFLLSFEYYHVIRYLIKSDTNENMLIS